MSSTAETRAARLLLEAYEAFIPLAPLAGLTLLDVETARMVAGRLSDGEVPAEKALAIADRLEHLGAAGGRMSMPTLDAAEALRAYAQEVA